MVYAVSTHNNDSLYLIVKISHYLWKVGKISQEYVFSYLVSSDKAG